jgi:outer membrane protein
LKKIFCRTFLVLGLAFAATAQAADVKIGFVNAARVSAEAPQADVARQKLEKEFAPRDQEVVTAQKEVKALEEKLARDGAVMKESERARLERDIISQKRDIRRMQDEFREDFNMRRNEELAKLQRRIIEVIQQLAKDEKFDLIVSDGVVYASDQVDITAKVIERLQQESRAGKQ